LVPMFSFRLECAPVDRIWCPAVACPVCLRPNDHDFCFCQACGFKRPLLMENVPRVEVDEDFIRRRKEQLSVVQREFSYVKAKEAEYVAFTSFFFFGAGEARRVRVLWGDTAPPGRKVVGPPPTSNPRFERVHLLLGHVGLVNPGLAFVWP